MHPSDTVSRHSSGFDDLQPANTRNIITINAIKNFIIFFLTKVTNGRIFSYSNREVANGFIISFEMRL
jgi:hypothetical protein